MSRVPRRRWMLVAALAATGCLSPTLPLPPPTRPDVEGPDQSGFVTLTGGVPSGAEAYVLNPRTDRIAGQVTDSSGRYTLRIEAVSGDDLVFWYVQGLTISPNILVPVP